MKKVIVSLSSNSIAARECFIGVFNYVNAGHDWQMRIVSSPQEITPEAVAKALRDGVNGILTGVDRDTPGFRAIVESGIPAAFINTPPNWHSAAGRPIAVLHNDDMSIGRAGADFFRKIGRFMSYGFVPTEEKTFWSTYRKRGFRTALAARRQMPTTFNPNAATLEEWIAALPKPAAVMAATDQLAIHVIETCVKLRLSVPDHVAVLGVDNDELYCINARPTLSSIHPNHVELGRRAAEALDRMMRRPVQPRTAYIPPIGVVERESTRTIPPAGHLIQQALDFIRQHYGDRIGVKEVAKHLHVSEQLLRLRFRQMQGRSVRDTLLGIRLDEARRLLSETRLPVSEVASKCGFASACRMAHFFTERTGAPPSAWRHTLGRQKPSTSPESRIRT